MAQAGQEKEAELSWRSTAHQAAKKEGLGASVSYAQGAIERGTLPFLEGETGERSSHLGDRRSFSCQVFIIHLLRSKHFSRCWGEGSGDPCPLRAYILVGRQVLHHKQ